MNVVSSSSGHLIAGSRGPLWKASRRVLVLLLVISAGLAAAVNTRAFGPRGGAVAAATRNLAWKVSGRQTAVYLVGSVHVLSADYYPINPAIETAFKDSDLLVEEVDLAEGLEPELQLRMLTRGMLPPGQSLDTVVSPATFTLLGQTLMGLGMPIEPLKRFKPWLLALTLVDLSATKAGFEANLGLDRHFYDLAKADGRLIQGLETPEFQISRFDEMSMSQQDRLLASTLKDVATATESLTKLADAWKSGDVGLIERLAFEDFKTEPEMYQRFLVDRNRNWLPKIDALFNRRGRAFVVVGAAHLVGPDGLITMLKAKGYTVEQL
jgi:uncharacterized protein YbaP (TraB family)